MSSIEKYWVCRKCRQLDCCTCASMPSWVEIELSREEVEAFLKVSMAIQLAGINLRAVTAEKQYDQ